MMLEACNRTQHSEPDKEKDTQRIIIPARAFACARALSGKKQCFVNSRLTPANGLPQARRI